MEPTRSIWQSHLSLPCRQSLLKDPSKKSVGEVDRLIKQYIAVQNQQVVGCRVCAENKRASAQYQGLELWKTTEISFRCGFLVADQDVSVDNRCVDDTISVVSSTKAFDRRKDQLLAVRQSVSRSLWHPNAVKRKA